MINKYEKLRKDGFEIAGVTEDDLRCGVFDKLSIPWNNAEEPEFFPFYLQWSPEEGFNGYVWCAVSLTTALFSSPELHYFNNFRDFLDYLEYKGE